MQKIPIFYGFDNGNILYALMVRDQRIRVWIERPDGTFYAPWSLENSNCNLSAGEFFANTWGDYHGLMASALLSTGWFKKTGKESIYPPGHIYDDGWGEIWALADAGSAWLDSQAEAVASSENTSIST